MILGIDIDNTITCTKEVIKEYLKKEYPLYDDYKLLPKKEYIRFLKKNMKKMRSEYVLKEGVKEAFDYFHQNNFHIIIITARNNKYYRESKLDTIKYLCDHGLIYDKIFFNKPKKGKTAFKEHVDLFIDDKEAVLDGVSKYGIKCLCMRDSSKYPSFHNWYEIVDYIKKEVKHGR